MGSKIIQEKSAIMTKIFWIIPTFHNFLCKNVSIFPLHLQLTKSAIFLKIYSKKSWYPSWYLDIHYISCLQEETTYFGLEVSGHSGVRVSGDFGPKNHTRKINIYIYYIYIYIYLYHIISYITYIIYHHIYISYNIYIYIYIIF